MLSCGINAGHLVTWDGMKAGLLERFVVTEHANFFNDLCKLKPTGSIVDYQTQFERLLSHVGTLIDQQEAECFTSGLKDGLEAIAGGVDYGSKATEILAISFMPCSVYNPLKPFVSLCKSVRPN